MAPLVVDLWVVLLSAIFIEGGVKKAARGRRHEGGVGLVAVRGVHGGR